MAAGIETISELKAVPEDDLPHLKVNTPGISLATLKKWRDQPAHGGAYPYHVIDYRKAANPYKEKYGEDEWRDKIRTCVFMNKYMYVKELVEKIHD